ncbi:MAG: AMP-binding protein, partial [Nitrososphaerota archaeon]|nr:AMP-binding protein [Nitrososphaerota archaeon]
MTDDGKFVWTPSTEFVTTSNLMKFMVSKGIESFEELRKRSVTDPEWFWGSICDHLNIEWYSRYSRVKDDSGGMQWTKWFVGGKLNITYNCVDKFIGKLDSKIALYCESEKTIERRTLTYKELSDLTNRIANTLRRRLDVRKGDKVGLFMPMSAESVATFFAIIKVGAIVVPVFSGYGKDAISARLNDCEAKVIVTVESFFRKGRKIRMLDTVIECIKEIPSIAGILVNGSFNTDQVETPGIKMMGWDAVTTESIESNAEIMDSEDPFMIIYTSGTTGKPKGAIHVHGGFLAKISEEMAFQMDLKHDDILFWFTDMGWIMAPWELVGALSLGGSILVYSGAPDYPAPDRLWEIVESNRVTKLGVSPTLVRSLKKYGDEYFVKHDLSSIRAFGSTGEPWDSESYGWLFRRVGNGKRPIVNLSGGTEVGACFLSVHPVLPIKACSLGGPCLGIDADVVDYSGKSVRNNTGELVIRNSWPSMTRGLWKDPSRYFETYWSKMPNAWVHGDWASVDEDGYWYLYGRSDDTIKVAGKRIGPGEIEDALASHESVLESVAIGLPDELKGESISCFVVLRPKYIPSENLRKDLSDHVAEAL